MATTESKLPILDNVIVESKRWESFGSGLAVEREKEGDTREKMKFSLKRQLKYFGAAIQFSDSTLSDNKKSSVDFAPSEDKAFNLHMRQRNKGTQIVIQLQDVACQTITPKMKNIWTQYAPREFDEEEKNKILKSDGIADFLTSAVPRLQDSMEQSEIFDIFQDDFKILGNYSKSDN